MEIDFYEVLGVGWDASPEDIRSAYFQAVHLYHPDANPDPKAMSCLCRFRKHMRFYPHRKREVHMMRNNQLISELVRSRYLFSIAEVQSR